MRGRLEIEVDFEKIVDDAIATTISEGLNADREELIYTYSRKDFKEMQDDYRCYGTLFSMNFKRNLEKEIKNIFKEDKER